MKHLEHGGDLKWYAEKAQCKPEEIVDFSANINPLGAPEWLRPLLSSFVSSLGHYPDPHAMPFIKAVANRFVVSPDEIIAGNGCTELIRVIARVSGKKIALIPVPAYSDYQEAAELAGLQVEHLYLEEANGFHVNLQTLDRHILQDSLVFLGHPANPIGCCLDVKCLIKVAQAHPESLFVVDESFIDFTDNPTSLRAQRPSNVITLYSLTKSFAIPGLRLGCGFASPALIKCLQPHIMPWSVNTLAQCVGSRAMEDEEHLERTRHYVKQLRESLEQRLLDLGGFTVYKSEANYLLVRGNSPGFNAVQLAVQLLKKRIAIRLGSNFKGLNDRFFRLAVRPQEEQDQLINAMSEVVLKKHHSVRPRKTPAIMFQGTSSNAGKSVLAAAFCRILLQDGYNVAPYKAQNMSLNSCVTYSGAEMGRAQVVQAQACHLNPDVRMNPILLKPSSDTGSQIILMGHPVGNMNFMEYNHFKSSQARSVALKAYDSLASEHNVMVLEGAGSPGEVNLKDRDLVNMAMARHAGAPVLIVGDIDRGGVYASFVGTMEVLAEWERNMVSGFIVNRFRGDASLLTSAHEYVLTHTGRPVMGVVPFIPTVGLPEEDSVEFKSRALDAGPPTGDYIEIAVIDLPHISNFTDVDAFRIEPDCHLRIIRSVQELGTPDVLLIPGSKNVIGDMHYLFEYGLASCIESLAHNGYTEIVGLCGGFQILGGEIEDPYGLESSRNQLHGLGLLPIHTILEKEKTLIRTHAKHLPSNTEIHGYEIHHGKTTGKNVVPVVLRDDGEVIGVSVGNDRIWGTYLHGIFDADAFRRWFIDRIRVRKKMKPLKHIVAHYDLEPALDRLAEVVREGIDVKTIYGLMGL